jgi:hypothetical protein
VSVFSANLCRIALCSSGVALPGDHEADAARRRVPLLPLGPWRSVSSCRTTAREKRITEQEVVIAGLVRPG